MYYISPKIAITKTTLIEIQTPGEKHPEMNGKFQKAKENKTTLIEIQTPGGETSRNEWEMSKGKGKVKERKEAKC